MHINSRVDNYIRLMSYKNFMVKNYDDIVKLYLMCDIKNLLCIDCNKFSRIIFLSSQKSDK